MSPSQETVLITGLSGSGKSTALGILEDMGFFCIDNLPANLLLNATNRKELERYPKLAITMDAREKNFLQDYEEVFEHLRSVNPNLTILFFEAAPNILQRRYNVSRRLHPYSSDGPVLNSIQLEREELSPIRELAHEVIDTSTLAPRDVYEIIRKIFSDESHKAAMRISLVSFGFSSGILENADLIFDVRFLPNPHFHPQLSRFTGKDKAIQDFVFAFEETKQFIDHMNQLLGFLIPNYQREGKHYLTIGFGCTGGQHRSVAITEKMHRLLKKQNQDIQIFHRDLGSNDP